jgi:hypothetical protein
MPTRPRPTHHSSSKKICLREESFYPQQISLSQLKDKKVDYVLFQQCLTSIWKNCLSSLLLQKSSREWLVQAKANFEF